MGLGAELAGGAVELPEGEGEGEQDDGPDGDEDGVGPAVVEVGPDAEDVVAVADAEPGGDDVAEEAGDGERPHELFAGHVDGAGGEDEGPEGHGWGEDGRERDGDDGVALHPGGDAADGALGDVLLEEGHAAGGACGVGDEASDGGAEGGDDDEEDGVGVGGGVDDDEDVGDAGDGEGDEGAVDDGDEEETDEAEAREEMQGAVVGGVMRGLRSRSGGGEREDGGGRGVR